MAAATTGLNGCIRFDFVAGSVIKIFKGLYQGYEMVRFGNEYPRVQKGVWEAVLETVNSDMNSDSAAAAAAEN